MQTEPSKLPFVDYHPVEQQESNEAIKVVVRFRTNEVKDKDSITIKEDGKSVTIKKLEAIRKSQTITTRNSFRGQPLDPHVISKTKVFNYDAVTDTDNQKLFYELYAKENVLEFLKGYNSTILAYGSTGSGKTFTIIGDEQTENQILKSNCKDLFPESDMQGILPRSIQTIYEEMQEGKSKGIKYKMKCSYLEVYNEELTDLLQKAGQSSSAKKPLVRYFKRQLWGVTYLMTN